MDNNEKSGKEIRVANLIALCHILDDYHSFIERLNDLISTKYNRDIICQLHDISHDKYVFGCHKIKTFYQQNKETIDTINKFSSIFDFIVSNYDSQGILLEDSSLDFFYQYLFNHKDQMDKILSLLEKIKELGFQKILFDEDENFMKYQCTIRTYFNGNHRIAYLDNIKIIPNYQHNIVQYHSTGSNYAFTAETYYGELVIYGKCIRLNSLTFDTTRLPDEITKESIFDSIIHLNEQQQNNCSIIRNSVDLSVGIDDLYKQFHSTSTVIEKLEHVDDKKELQKILLSIRNEIVKLQAFSSKYDDNVSKNNSFITKDILHREKQKYLKRRDWAEVDFD